MMGAVRYTIVVLAVLLFAAVFVTAGAGACGECIHGCCTRTNNSRTFRSVIRRVMRAFSGLARGVLEALAAFVPVFVDPPALGLPVPVGVIRLRI